MFNARNTLYAVMALMVAGPLAADPEFNVDTETAGDNATRIWLSYLADNDVTAIEFQVELDGSGNIRGDSRDCLSRLPKSHRGRCKLEGNTLRGVIFSPTNAALSDTNIGSVLLDPDSLLKAGGEKGQVNIASVEVTTVNAQGQSMGADIRVSGQLAQGGKQGD